MSHPKPTNTSKAIGLRLRDTCGIFYKTKTECAKNYGVPPQTWSRMEQGSVRFDSEDIFRLAAFFNVDPAWLLTGRKELAPDWLGKDNGKVEEE